VSGHNSVESLRWILLAAGIAFIVIVYVLGRSRRQRNTSMVDELEDELPEFSARSLDDVDEGVGKVRVVTTYLDPVDQDMAEREMAERDMDLSAQPDTTMETSSTISDNNAGNNKNNDIIVLYILPKADQVLRGSQINSAVQAMGLSFGEMNIFHYKDGSRSVFSLANMLEPGSFDADTIHDLKTTGLTVFMQIHDVDPLDDLTEMLQRSYQLAGLLDARLCNHRRLPMTEQDAENYRTQVKEFSDIESAELSSES
jgi:cell division protein ZipA